MPHLFQFTGHGTYSPDGKIDPPLSTEQVAQINADTTKAELTYWATVPERFAPAYYEEKKGIVTTWNGGVLGTIIAWRIYQHNFGGRFVCLRIKGNNGAEYYGRASYDGGTIIRLRKARE